MYVCMYACMYVLCARMCVNGLLPCSPHCMSTNTVICGCWGFRKHGAQLMRLLGSGCGSPSVAISLRLRTRWLPEPPYLKQLWGKTFVARMELGARPLDGRVFCFIHGVFSIMLDVLVRVGFFTGSRMKRTISPTRNPQFLLSSQPPTNWFS